MKKKLLIASLALFGAIACVGAAACGHEHSYSDKWSSNETSHWHEASCDDTDEIIDEGISELKNFYHDLGLTTHIKELIGCEPDIEKMVKNIVF